MADVDDPYGLADESPAPTSRREDLAGAALADQELAPLPRAGFDPSSNKKRMRGNEGPWGLPIRQAAMGLMVIAGVMGRASRVFRESGQTEALQYVGLGLVGTCLIAASLSAASVIGAAVSLARGNRQAFSGESTHGQIGWLMTVVASCLLPCLWFAGSQGSVRARMDAKLSAVEKADIAVYDRLINEMLALHDRLGRLMEQLVVAQGPEARALQVAQVNLQRDYEGLMREVAGTPMPTRAQVKQLFDRYHERVLAAILRTSQGMHKVVASLNLPPGNEVGKALKKSEADTAKHANAYKSLFPANATDSTGWYFAVFGEAVAPRR